MLKLFAICRQKAGITLQNVVVVLCLRVKVSEGLDNNGRNVRVLLTTATPQRYSESKKPLFLT